MRASRARDRADLVADDWEPLKEKLEAGTSERTAALKAVEPERGKGREGDRDTGRDKDRGSDRAESRGRMIGPETEKAREPKSVDLGLSL